MEIQFLHGKVIGEDPKLLMDHVHRMASGEIPFFPTTLSLVYDKLVEKSFTKPISFGLDFDSRTEDKSPIDPTPPLQTSGSTPAIDASPTINPVAPPSNSQAPASTTEPITLDTPSNSTWLKCVRCGELARLRDLYEYLRCPRCPERGKSGRPFMQCLSCDASRVTLRDDCSRKKCRKRFM
ncbi:hypothetical protein BDM02DRAFT_1688248 [Thelephora ganbajun]|uniref:Uncharacterized protein n=1 Tax=Thelephora ganbajun TaxID=370292 RepID=A0ACB6ZJQ2_THEGA|nr:hypothetical protein BDM02DRAFT_1688248 [Thelephora ganbajun]